MGLNADAQLVWGIPVLAYDDDYEPTGWWDEENDDWRSFPGTELTIRMYGHYEDPDNKRGILTLKSAESYLADCWEAVSISARYLDMNEENEYKDAMYEVLHEAGLAEVLSEPMGWWLVVSYG